MRIAATAAVVVVAAAVAVAQPRALERAGIEAAIAFGEAGEPRPYLLRHQGRPDNPVVVGAVYTPFVRVAMLAKATAARGEHLSPASIDGTVTSPLVYIAFRWYCCDAGPDAAAASEPRVLMLPVAPRAPQYVNVMDRRGAVEPVWARKGTAVLESFGASPPYDDIALVAAFPAGAVQTGRPFVIYKEAGGATSIRTGVVRADDAAAWR